MGTVDLHELKVYQLAMRVGEDVWSVTAGWDLIAKQSVGLQWIRAADSIAANISEGAGRSSAQEIVQFCHYALGALRQTQTWLEKAAARRLVIHSVARELSLKLDTLRRQLDNYIETFEPAHSNSARDSSQHSSIHLLPLEEFFHPRTSAWHN
ncbi:MAG: four helix bundle protein [Verrucomicrobia bacterium]|nr:four helix bundle protein [Verrucomicrobiota bacterium]